MPEELWRQDIIRSLLIADKTIADLCRENENLLIFPYSIESSDDRLRSPLVMSILNTNDLMKVTG